MAMRGLAWPGLTGGAMPGHAWPLPMSPRMHHRSHAPPLGSVPVGSGRGGCNCPLTITQVAEDRLEDYQPMMEQDHILAINGMAIETYEDILFALSSDLPPSPSSPSPPAAGQNKH